jgi:sulfoxide reductase heme-binding subunit YedZ
MWLYFVNEKHNLRHDLFGFANDTGLISAMVFLLLLALSNDLSLRGLGTRRWKSLQRWGYAAALLVIAHGLAYQQIEARRLPERVVSYAIVAAVLGLQLFGWMRTRQQLRARNAGALVGSASSTPLST